MNFLELFDAIVRKTKVVLDKYVPPESMDTELASVGLDSLDYVMIFMELGEIFGIPEEIADNPPELITVQDIKNFIDEQKSRDFDSVEAALEVVQ